MADEMTKSIKGNHDEFLTVEDIAKKLKVPKSWVYARTREKGIGCMPRLRVGKYLRFQEQAVMEWLRENNKQE